MSRELGSLANHRGYLKLAPLKGPIEPFVMDPPKVFAAQVKGLAKRLKAVGSRHCVVGLSGGLDSSLALLVVHATFGRLGYDMKGIHVITMPGFATSKRTLTNAKRLCSGLDLALETIDITKACKQHFRDIGHDGVTPDVTFENAQARMRTLILMDRANMVGGLVIGTGDLSEIALGWNTYNGDHMSMFAVNSGVPKTVVRKVCRWYADRQLPASPIRATLDDIIATPVSPELVEGQVTEDTIGPYELHDFFLWNFITNEMGQKDLLRVALPRFSKTYPPALIRKTLDTFMRRFFTQAFKRNCAPDGVRVFSFDLSPHGWWIPSDLGIMRV